MGAGLEDEGVDTLLGEEGAEGQAGGAGAHDGDWGQDGVWGGEGGREGGWEGSGNGWKEHRSFHARGKRGRVIGSYSGNDDVPGTRKHFLDGAAIGWSYQGMWHDYESGKQWILNHFVASGE